MPDPKTRGWVEIDQEECKGCGFCMDVCPAGCLEPSRSLNHLGYHPMTYCGDGCRADGLCFYACPEPGAISVYKGNPDERAGRCAEARATVLFAFNRPSIERFAPEVIEGGLVIYDSSLVAYPPSMSGVEAIPVPASDIADRLGSARSANMVAGRLHRPDSHPSPFIDRGDPRRPSEARSGGAEHESARRGNDTRGPGFPGGSFRGLTTRQGRLT